MTNEDYNELLALINQNRVRIEHIAMHTKNAFSALNKIHNNIECFEQRLHKIENDVKQLSTSFQENDKITSTEQAIQRLQKNFADMKQQIDMINDLLSAFFDVNSIF